MNVERVTGALQKRLQRLRPSVQQATPVEVEGEPRFVLFFSFTDSTSRATVVTVNEPTLEAAWQAGTAQIAASQVDARWLRVEWIDAVEQRSWKTLRSALREIKRNYFRLGIALDPAFHHAFLETELNANAMLYGGSSEAAAVLNEKNFRIYAGKRHGLAQLSFADDDPVWLFNTRGAFIGDDLQVCDLSCAGLDSGRRAVDQLDPDAIARLIHSGSSYLASQVLPDGRFHYGWHPCFDRPIRAYNALRHASTLYAMLEAWEVTRGDDLKQAIERARRYLVEELIQSAPAPSAVQAAFLVDTGNEIKLGGNAVAVLALLKHHELTGVNDSIALAQRLGAGILFMQDANGGCFTHVLHYPSLREKERFRIIYYDGEAAFALMRLYEVTGDTCWLAAVEKAFDHFTDKDHWQSHDHWLGYCVNELTKYRKKDRYFRFGLDNVRGHLDFVLERITTFPTLLELMTAAERMIARLRADPARRHLLDGFDLERFYRALHFRAHYLLNGHFWPELAMFFAKPGKIVGSFFIRHHAFRIRIDDVEHYLSGLVAYRRYLLASSGTGGEMRCTPVGTLRQHWSAGDVERATGGQWEEPPLPGWSGSGLCVSAPDVRPGDMVALRAQEGFQGGVAAALVPHVRDKSTAFIASKLEWPDDCAVPCLRVEDVGTAILDLGTYARQQIQGAVIGVIGSGGNAGTVAMMAHVLKAYGAVGTVSSRANHPHGIAAGLASIPWNVQHSVLELGFSRLARNARLVKPNIAVFTNFPADYPAYHEDLATIADRKTMIFRAMQPGAVVVLDRDMDDWHHVHLAARSRGLRVVCYGRSAECDLQLLEYDVRHDRARARIGQRELDFAAGATAEYAAVNAPAVLATLTALGHDLETALNGLASFYCIGGEQQVEKEHAWQGTAQGHSGNAYSQTVTTGF